jgi:hypothetical protein
MFLSGQSRPSPWTRHRAGRCCLTAGHPCGTCQARKSRPGSGSSRPWPDFKWRWSIGSTLASAPVCRTCRHRHCRNTWMRCSRTLTCGRTPRQSCETPHARARAADHPERSPGDSRRGHSPRVRSVGSKARDGADDVWLRVVFEDPEWGEGDYLGHNVAANEIRDVPKPVVSHLDHRPRRLALGQRHGPHPHRLGLGNLGSGAHRLRRGHPLLHKPPRRAQQRAPAHGTVRLPRQSKRTARYRARSGAPAPIRRRRRADRPRHPTSKSRRALGPLASSQLTAGPVALPRRRCVVAHVGASCSCVEGRPGVVPGSVAVLGAVCRLIPVNPDRCRSELQALRASDSSISGSI